MKLIKILLLTKDEECRNLVIDYFKDNEIISIQTSKTKLNYDILISDQYQSSYKANSVFLVSKDSFLENYKENKVKYFLKPYNPYHIELEVLRILNNKLNKKDLEDLLLTLGFSNHLKSYDYLLEAIYLFNEDRNLKEVYVEVAKTFDTSPSNIERQIRYIIEVSCLKGDLELLNDLFSYSIDYDKAKPTNKQFIKKMSEYV